MKGNARLQPFFQVELTADTYIAECDEKKFVIYENAERAKSFAYFGASNKILKEKWLGVLFSCLETIRHKASINVGIISSPFTGVLQEEVSANDDEISMSLISEAITFNSQNNFDSTRPSISAEHKIGEVDCTANTRVEVLDEKPQNAKFMRNENGEATQKGGHFLIATNDSRKLMRLDNPNPNPPALNRYHSKAKTQLPTSRGKTTDQNPFTNALNRPALAQVEQFPSIGRLSLSPNQADKNENDTYQELYHADQEQKSGEFDPLSFVNHRAEQSVISNDNLTSSETVLLKEIQTLIALNSQLNDVIEKVEEERNEERYLFTEQLNDMQNAIDQHEIDKQLQSSEIKTLKQQLSNQKNEMQQHASKQLDLQQREEVEQMNSAPSSAQILEMQQALRNGMQQWDQFESERDALQTALQRSELERTALLHEYEHVVVSKNFLDKELQVLTLEKKRFHEIEKKNESLEIEVTATTQEAQNHRLELATARVRERELLDAMESLESTVDSQRLLIKQLEEQIQSSISSKKVQEFSSELAVISLNLCQEKLEKEKIARDLVESKGLCNRLDEQNRTLLLTCGTRENQLLTDLDAAKAKIQQLTYDLTQKEADIRLLNRSLEVANEKRLQLETDSTEAELRFQAERANFVKQQQAIQEELEAVDKKLKNSYTRYQQLEERHEIDAQTLNDQSNKLQSMLDQLAAMSELCASQEVKLQAAADHSKECTHELAALHEKYELVQNQRLFDGDVFRDQIAALEEKVLHLQETVIHQDQKLEQLRTAEDHHVRSCENFSTLLATSEEERVKEVCKVREEMQRSQEDLKLQCTLKDTQIEKLAIRNEQLLTENIRLNETQGQILSEKDKLDLSVQQLLSLLKEKKGQLDEQVKQSQYFEERTKILQKESDECTRKIFSLNEQLYEEQKRREAAEYQNTQLDDQCRALQTNYDDLNLRFLELKKETEENSKQMENQHFVRLKELHSLSEAERLKIQASHLNQLKDLEHAAAAKYDNVIKSFVEREKDCLEKERIFFKELLQQENKKTEALLLQSDLRYKNLEDAENAKRKDLESLWSVKYRKQELDFERRFQELKDVSDSRIEEISCNLSSSRIECDSLARQVKKLQEEMLLQSILHQQLQHSIEVGEKSQLRVSELEQELLVLDSRCRQFQTDKEDCDHQIILLKQNNQLRQEEFMASKVKLAQERSDYELESLQLRGQLQAAESELALNVNLMREIKVTLVKLKCKLRKQDSKLKQMTPTEEYNNLQRSYEAALDNLKCEIALSDKNWTTILHEALLLQLGSPNGGSVNHDGFRQHEKRMRELQSLFADIREIRSFFIGQIEAVLGLSESVLSSSSHIALQSPWCTVRKLIGDTVLVFQPKQSLTGKFSHMSLATLLEHYRSASEGFMSSIASLLSNWLSWCERQQFEQTNYAQAHLVEMSALKAEMVRSSSDWEEKTKSLSEQLEVLGRKVEELQKTSLLEKMQYDESLERLEGLVALRELQIKNLNDNAHWIEASHEKKIQEILELQRRLFEDSNNAHTEEMLRLKEVHEVDKEGLRQEACVVSNQVQNLTKCVGDLQVELVDVTNRLEKAELKYSEESRKRKYLERAQRKNSNHTSGISVIGNISNSKDDSFDIWTVCQRCQLTYSGGF